MTPTEFKEQYERDGYVILRNFIPRETLDAVQSAVENIVDELANDRVKAGSIPQSFADEPFNMRFKKIFENDPQAGPIQFNDDNLHQPEFFDLYSYPPLLDLVESYLGSEVRLLIYVVRNRAFLDEKYKSLWHQDAGYLGAGRGNPDIPDDEYNKLRYINCWTPLVPVNKENGCMEFIPGSHKLGVVKHIPVPPHGYLHIDYDIINPYIEAGKAVDIELDVGDIVLFQNLIFHQGHDNLSGKVRWNADFRYQDARQETLTKVQGHLIRSRERSELVVSSKEEWARRSWG